MDDVDVGGLFIDGEHVVWEKLSFREQREARDEILKLAPNGDPDMAGAQDIIPAVIYVYRKRSDPAYTIDQALEVKQADLAAPEEKPGPPRKSRTSSKA